LILLRAHNRDYVRFDKHKDGIHSTIQRPIHDERNIITYSSGLGLCDQISSTDGGSDSTLLNGRRFFETVRVDTTKKFFGQFHSIKGFDNLVPVGTDVSIG
jgi:hypothetical protein